MTSSFPRETASTRNYWTGDPERLGASPIVRPHVVRPPQVPTAQAARAFDTRFSAPLAALAPASPARRATHA
jgi:hypothetical protein